MPVSAAQDNALSNLVERTLASTGCWWGSILQCEVSVNGMPQTRWARRLETLALTIRCWYYSALLSSTNSLILQHDASTNASGYIPTRLQPGTTRDRPENRTRESHRTNSSQETDTTSPHPNAFGPLVSSRKTRMFAGCWPLSRPGRAPSCLRFRNAPDLSIPTVITDHLLTDNINYTSLYPLAA